MFKIFFHWLKVRSIKRNGGILWTRWNDNYEILTKTYGEITKKSPSAYVPCKSIVLGAEGGPNGHQGYVLKDSWNELGSPFQLGYHTCLQGMGHLAAIKPKSEPGSQSCAFLYPGAQMDLYDPTPDGVVDYWVEPLNQETWPKVATHDIPKLLLATQNAVNRLEDSMR